MMKTPRLTKKNKNNANQPVVLILGAYGIFGSRIAKSLFQSGIQLVLVGRHRNRLTAFKQQLLQSACHRNTLEPDTALIDVSDSRLSALIQAHNAHIVINTCGPFQNAPYTVA